MRPKHSIWPLELNERPPAVRGLAENSHSAAKDTLVTGCIDIFYLERGRYAAMLREPARKLLLFYLVVDVVINLVNLASGKSSQRNLCLWALTERV